MKEFDLIRQLREMTAVADLSAAGVALGIGDDAAVLRVPAGHDLVVATDTLNSGTHFPAETPPCDIAYKCLAVNLSDLASMGASPRWALLSLALPGADPGWVHSFAEGFNELAQAHGVARDTYNAGALDRDARRTARAKHKRTAYNQLELKAL